MREIYVFYADVFLLQNFVMDLIALAAANRFLNRRRKPGWLLLAAGFFSVAGLLLLLYLKDYLLYCIFTHFFLNTGMVLLAFGRMGGREFLKVWFVTYLSVLLTGGILEWLGGIGVWQVCAAAAVLALTALLLEWHKSFGRQLLSAEIRSGERRMQLRAYYDSGNQLRDIYTGKAVSILCHDKFEDFLGEEGNVRYVPFRALGDNEGLIPVTDVDELVIYHGKHAAHIRQAAIGAANEGLLEKKEYDLILHASLHE